MKIGFEICSTITAAAYESFQDAYDTMVHYLSLQNKGVHVRKEENGLG